MTLAEELQDKNHAFQNALSWYALWTHSHCEHLVHQQLAAKGFQVLLPQIEVWSARRGVRRAVRVPMFPGYLFLSHVMDKHSYIEVRKARGLVNILGGRWDQLLTVPEVQINGIRQLMQSSLPLLPYPYLKKGQRVRITDGPLANVEGILVRTKPNSGRLVLSIDLLKQSVAADVDCALVVPV
ncbi:MAG TPA: transcription termination/antitermination NusG family protein [Candidatus Binatia bacterium]|nr:transcription termination/antitermination NusG family protein [Candidatus Binatia bacterium]